MVYIPSDVNKAVRRKLERRRYSDKTVKSYLYWINRFLKWSKKELRYVSKKDVSAFLQKLQNKNLAGNTMNTALMSLKFLFEDVMERRMWINIKYSKVPKKIQRSLSKQEVNQLIKNVNNPQHKLMVALMYSAGLRVSELINLKVEDLFIEKGYGFVRNGKGKKDRIFVISEKLKIPLKQICLQKKKEDFIFISNRKNKYTIRSLQQIVKKTAKKAKIEKWEEVHPHTLRHSFATHLIEQGDSVSDVQAMLGHKSPETSLEYIHKSGKMLNIKSPLDYL